MRPKVSIYIASSIDGYIARKDGDLTWLIGREVACRLAASQTYPSGLVQVKYNVVNPRCRECVSIAREL